MDKELDDKKKALEKTLDDEEKLVADSIDLVNKNSTTVLDNLNRLSREYGIQMSNSLTEPFTHGENALSHYSTMFSEANSAFTDQLNYTAMGIYQLQLDADNAAVSVVNMFNSAMVHYLSSYLLLDSHCRKLPIRRMKLLMRLEMQELQHLQPQPPLPLIQQAPQIVVLVIWRMTRQVLLSRTQVHGRMYRMI